MVTVRPAEHGDVPAVQRVARETWHAAYDSVLGPEAVDATVEEWYADSVVADGVANDATTYLVAVDDGVVGYAFGGQIEADLASLSAIYVQPDRWGAGIGHRLFVALTDRLRERGRERLQIRVLAANDRARTFYERHGATLVDRQQITLADVPVDEVTYERPL
ncbi:GNAT family N-acetyltransferase [Halomicrobium mukohataei]|uniref:GNAT family N-acetyltransferase n=1 Tax=Halomicrobium mukohataei TaxID=57705 RepID=A0A847TZZ0_9EURY|nr:GNAT family N-acetyltransferase [Halomicrobium mukohataei]NLV08893.1 GNAT family N-acetyltransferase [Halomicrobium mukohataei]